MRFIVRIPTKDVGLTLEATVKAPNWRDALTRVLEETGGNGQLLDRAHIHIRRDGRIVVEDPDTLRVYELRSELEEAEPAANNVQEVALPTKKRTRPIRRGRASEPVGQENKGDDARTAIGTPALKLGADGQYFQAPIGVVHDEAEPRSATRPSDTAPQLPEGSALVSAPSQSPNRAGFQPVLSGEAVVRPEEGPKEPEELPSVIVNLPQDPPTPEVVPEGAGDLVDDREGDVTEKEPEASQTLESLQAPEAPTSDEPEQPLEEPRAELTPKSMGREVEEEPDTEAQAAKKIRKNDIANVRQNVPVMKAPDDFEDIRSGRSLEVVAGTFLRAVRKRVTAELGVVLVPDSRQKYVLIAAGFGLPKNFKLRRFKFGDGAGGFACEFESPIQLDDPAARPELIGKFEALFPDAVSIIAFPVRVPNNTFGAIELVRTQGSAFSREEYHLVEQLCEAQASKIA